MTTVWIYVDTRYLRRAAELAAKAIDKHADTSAPSAERESRKNRLLKGPSVFWDVRKGM